ncbi:MAG: endonuclease/exonuclease/phosphatase family protein [Alphaproteobacteria bacterium]
MENIKILFSNLGYARGINGGLPHHIGLAHRHFYSSQHVQKIALKQLSDIIALEDPDICCFVEIDNGSFTSARFNQLEALLSEKYSFFDVENKYAPGSLLRSFFLTRGKSNAFIAKKNYSHEKIFFSNGTKRLIYKIMLADGITLFFAHFALSRKVRALQIKEIGDLIKQTPGNALLLGDFNILTGFGELEALVESGRLTLLNKEDEPTFRFHKRHLVLDLCLCSRDLLEVTKLKVIPQPYSDHAALLVEAAISR